MKSVTPPCLLPAQLQRVAEEHKLGLETREFAKAADSQDPLSALRSQYHLPLASSVHPVPTSPTSPQPPVPSEGETSLYLCGNSLGPLAKRSQQVVLEEVNAWGTHGVLGHFNHPFGPDRQWTRMDDKVNWLMSDIVGAKPSEVVAMNTLTGNLHTVLQTFYRPLAKQSARHKIIHEQSPFPSDQYALASVVQLNGFDPKTSLVPLKPEAGTKTLDTEDILETMEQQAATGECWGILLGGIQYLTGQLFELERIAKKARELDIYCGFDLAHAFANVPLALHDWGVDFAVWCTYKYGSSGPGGIAGLFIHEKWGGSPTFSTQDPDPSPMLRPAGWWGHKRSTRFAMPSEFDPTVGAAGWQVSNPSTMDMAVLRGSLETLALSVELSPAGASDHARLVGTQPWAKEQEAKTTVGSGSIMPVLRTRSLQLTGYLEYLLFHSARYAPVFKQAGMQLITPSDPHQRGSQLSIRIPNEDTTTSDGPGPSAQQSANASETETDGDNVPPPLSSESLISRIQTYAEEHFSLIADIRNPDVIRFAPLAQYSSFEDVWRAVDAFEKSVTAVCGLKA